VKTLRKKRQNMPDFSCNFKKQIKEAKRGLRMTKARMIIE
jgi:hypothetical protein